MVLQYILDIDWKLFYLINSEWTSGWADQFFPFITDLHKTGFFKSGIVPLVILLFMWLRGIKSGLIITVFCVVACISADGIGNHGFKKTFQRPRPGDTSGLVVQPRSPYGGYSFVSNHSANMFAFASFTAIIFPPAAVPVYALASLIGYSRIYNGVHFPTDVFGGALIGILCGILFAKLCKLLIRRYQPVEVIGS